MRRGWGLAFVAVLPLGCGSLIGLDDYGNGASVSSGGSGAAAGTTTGAGAEPCAGVLCGATCVLLDSDSKHCGACNHDCLGGDCVDGECQPVLLDEGVPGEIYKHIVVAGDRVFWSVASPDEIRAIPAEGGERSTFGSAPSPDFLAASATHLFASSFVNGAVYAWNLATAQMATLVSEGGPVAGIAVESSVAYYHRHAPQGAVRAIALSGTTANDIATEQYLGFGILVESDSVYWSTLGTGTVATPGTIATTLINGAGAPSVLAPNELKPSGIALDSTHVYWIDANARVRRVERNGAGMPKTMFTGFPASEGEKGFGQLVQVDQTHVYATVGAATSSAPYGLLRVGKTDQEARFVVPDVAIWGLAHDTVAVYYTIIVPSVEPPQLWRLAK
ncbi:MAG TPA: hypothetical protein VFB62_07405 [Polyangiaceae bacterium]|nr:hypothetical protein [Polyangiaceae bacterium]